MAVHVYQAGFAQKLGHPGALFGQEAGVLFVALEVFQVNLLVRYVDVAAQNEIALGFEGLQVRVHLGQKAELGLLTLLARRAAGKVAADDGMTRLGRVKTQLHVSALGVKLRRVVAHHHVAGFMAGVDAHAGVALFLGKVKVALQAGELLKAALHIVGLGLDLLHANTIRLVLGQPGFQAFGGGRADTVEVEAGQFKQGNSP